MGCQARACHLLHPPRVIKMLLTDLFFTSCAAAAGDKFNKKLRTKLNKRLAKQRTSYIWYAVWLNAFSSYYLFYSDVVFGIELAPGQKKSLPRER